MNIIQLRDREQIEQRLRRHTELHLYELGDLDDFFWPNTVLFTNGEQLTDPLVMLYNAIDLSTLIALEPTPSDSMKQLLNNLLPYLPHRFYSQMTAELVDQFDGYYRIIPHGKHCRMSLDNKTAVYKTPVDDVISLTEVDVPAILDLCNRGMEQHWFDPRMIETGCFFGIKKESRLICTAGIHTYSKQLRVSTLGNVVTDPEFRGQGLASRACAKLLKHLLTHIDHIGLNVSIDNTAAITLYQKLGFTVRHTYYETMFEPLTT